MIRITILKDGIRQAVEFEEGLNFDRVVGQVDGLMRRAWPDQMRRKCLNLSRDTTAGQQPQNLTPERDFINSTVPAGTLSGRINPSRGYFTAPRSMAEPSNWGEAVAVSDPGHASIGIGYSLDEGLPRADREPPNF